MTANVAFATRPELAGTLGMVASTHWLASAAGMGVLERGGNAFDAAVATAFVLHVAEPHLNGPGGEVPVLGYDAGRRAPFLVCGQGTAPARLTVEHARREGLDMIPGSGLLAPTVPGAVGGWLLLLRDHGTWRLRDVLEPALGYARAGVPLHPRVTSTIEQMAEYFQREWPSSAALWLDRGRAPEPGSRRGNPEWAAVLERLVREAEQATADREGQIEAARRSWYEGFVAAAIDAYLRTAEVHDSSDGRHRGVLRADDLAGWQATEERPLSFAYQDVEVLKTGPWGQGPVFLQQLALLGGHDLRGLDPCGADFVHLVVEGCKLAMADREAWYGDPAFTPDRTAPLLDPTYTQERRALIGEEASAELRPGAPGGRAPRLPEPGRAPRTDPATGDPTFERADRPAVRGDTCHLDVADRWGNLVSATPSGGWLQSSPAIPGLGFCLGTRAQIFTLQPGLPNTLEPKKRPRTTLSPSLALRDGEPWLAFGTPGADQQDQWSLAFFVRLLATGWDLQRVIDLPMFHTNAFPRSFAPHDWEPRSLLLEDRFDPAVVAELRRRGHEVQVQGAWSLGRLSAVEIDRDAGLLRGGANPRGMQGYAIGR
ncbi:MAG: gamma-glutamyltransferase family protein [Candidatus Dormibacteraceae bacterium]